MGATGLRSKLSRLSEVARLGDLQKSVVYLSDKTSFSPMITAFSPGRSRTTVFANPAECSARHSAVFAVGLFVLLLYLNVYFREALLVRTWLAAVVLIVCSLARSQSAQSETGLGFKQLTEPNGANMAVFYPTLGAEISVAQGPFRFSWVPDGQPLMGNRRLVVISHGSGGSPWVHVDLARALVAHGFTVAIPLHQGDNYLDPSEPGPVS